MDFVNAEIPEWACEVRRHRSLPCLLVIIDKLWKNAEFLEAMCKILLEECRIFLVTSSGSTTGSRAKGKTRAYFSGSAEGYFYAGRSC